MPLTLRIAKLSWKKNTQESNESDNESEDEILAEMQKEYEAEDSFGKDIQNPQLAKLLGKIFRSCLPDKALKDKLECQDRPENCETANPTRVNPGIWRKLREPTQKRDLQLYKMQLALVKGIMPVARLTDLSVTEKKGLDKEGVQQIKQCGLDAFSLLTHVNYELNMQRRQLMKPDIRKDCASLCSHTQFPVFLFDAIWCFSNFTSEYLRRLLLAVFGFDRNLFRFCRFLLFFVRFCSF